MFAQGALFLFPVADFLPRSTCFVQLYATRLGVYCMFNWSRSELSLRHRLQWPQSNQAVGLFSCKIGFGRSWMVCVLWWISSLLCYARWPPFSLDHICCCCYCYSPQTSAEPLRGPCILSHSQQSLPPKWSSMNVRTYDHPTMRLMIRGSGSVTYQLKQAALSEFPHLA